MEIGKPERIHEVELDPNEAAPAVDPYYSFIEGEDNEEKSSS